MAEYLNRLDWEERDPKGEDPDPYMTCNGDKIPFKKAIIEPSTDLISAKELLKLDIPPAEFIVEGLIPIGLTLIGAPAKSYKSFMMLQMSVAVAKGQSFMGFPVKSCGVLYLDLESTRRRPKSRLQHMLNGEEAPENLYISTQIDPINGYFETDLRSILMEHPEIRLVIVDVFNKIRPPKRGNPDPYERDCADYGYVKQLADELNVAIVLVTHTTKLKHSDDVFNELIGSAGVMGSVDAAIVLKKEKREATTTKIYTTGKDLEGLCYEAEFDKKLFKWKMLGDAETVQTQRKYEEYMNSNIIKTLLATLKQNNYRWSGTASELITISYALGTPIHQDATRVSGALNEYKPLLEKYEGITFYRDRSKKSREFVFSIIDF